MADEDLLGSRYEVLRTVSEGRRASVLQALDRVHDKLVALKVHAVTDSDRDGFLAEAQVLMSITPHPALPVVRGDFFSDDGQRYVVVMNWIDGVDLQQLLEEEGDPGLPLEEVIDVLAQVADALDHLHAHEPPIVHGDVKPGNVVRKASGQVVLVDFEIAGGDARHERLGTLGYAAPEVVAGEKPGPAADVFGLAATAVALLNGVPPSQRDPTFPGIDPGEVGQLSRILRNALATDPARRPHSAKKLVQGLRSTGRSELPTGVVALLAAEVADSGRLWAQDADEMRAAMTRLRDITEDVVRQGRGQIVASMNEGDRTIAVFREASAAALTALNLHESLAAAALPPGMDVRLRAAVAVGEATSHGGAYTGAVVEQLLRLRAAAGPGTTITSEPTAELLVELVGREISIVPLRRNVAGTPTQGGSVFALTRPGAEAAVQIVTQLPPPPPPGFAAPLPPPVARVASPATEDSTVSRRTLAFDALQHPASLACLTAVGLAIIYRSVLSPEIGLEWAASIAILVGAIAWAAIFGVRYSRLSSEQQAVVATRRHEREVQDRQRDLAQERAESRRRLDAGFERLTSDDGRVSGQVLRSLGDEYDLIVELLRRSGGRPAISMASLLPDLSDETYRQGMSALSDALELFESAEGAQRRRLEDETAEITTRLRRNLYADDRERPRDEQRLSSHFQLLARHNASRQRARELVFVAERCRDALTEARIELASLRAGEAQVDVDAVVQTLQETIRRVRDVQDEFRRLGH